MPFLPGSGHPVLVHLPLGLVAVLPLLALLGCRDARWTRPALLLGAVAWAGGLASLLTGLAWARALGMVPPGGFRPLASATYAAALGGHQIAASAGLLLGLAALLTLARAQRRAQGTGWLGGGLVFAWALAWAWAGHLGGGMVHGKTEAPAATAESDPEADLPLRALDFASLEPLAPRAHRSVPHGGRWARAWATPKAAEALGLHAPLPPGSWAVLVTSPEAAGWEPGPLYFRERKAEGSQGFAFYWARIPEREQAAMGGSDSLYWRSPDPRLADCVRCHADR